MSSGVLPNRANKARQLPGGLRLKPGCKGVSVNAYANYRGIRGSYIYTALKEGIISRLPDGSLDPIKCDLQWRRNSTKPFKPESAKVKQQRLKNQRATKQAEEAPVINDDGDDETEVPGSLVESRKRHVDVKTAQAELDLRRQLGDIVDRDKVKKQIFNLSRTFRDAVVNWPARMAAEIAAELGADPRQTLTVLEKQVRELLNEISRVSIDVKESA